MHPEGSRLAVNRLWCTKQPFPKTSSKKSQLQGPVRESADSSNSQVPAAKWLNFYEPLTVMGNQNSTVVYQSPEMQ